MKIKTKTKFSLILFAILVFSITSLILAYGALAGEIDPTFTLRSQTVTTDLSFTQTATATASGTALANNDRVCIGAITITPAITGTYSGVRDTKVECPTYGCAPRDNTTAATGILNTQLVTQATYNTIVSTYGACVYTGSSAPANIYATNVVYMNYARGDTLSDVRGSAATMNGVQCYGASTLRANGSLVGTVGFTGGSQIFTPSSVGNYNLSASYSVTGCGVMVRTYETDGPTYDCYLTGTATGTGNAPSITVNVVRGPVLTITGSSISSTIPSNDLGVFSISIRNDGDMNMTVNPASIGFSDGFAYSSSSPAGAFTLAPGASQTISGQVSSPTFDAERNVTATVPYTSPDTVVGACGAGSISFNIGRVAPAPPNQLTLEMNLNPTGILRGTNHNVLVTVEASRGGQVVEGTVGKVNMSILKWNGSIWQCAPGWCPPENPTIEDESIYFSYSDSGRQANASQFVKAYYSGATQVYPYAIGDDWLAGVYKVTVSAFDIRRSETVSVQNYFTIFTVALCDR